MATELMTLVQDGKIRPTVTEQIALEFIRRHWNVLPRGMSEAKSLPRSTIRSERRALEFSP